jgi:hypothetical protein
MFKSQDLEGRTILSTEYKIEFLGRWSIEFHNQQGAKKLYSKVYVKKGKEGIKEILLCLLSINLTS